MSEPAGTGKYTLCGIGAIVLWGLTVSLIRGVTEQLGAFTALSAVYLAGGAFAIGFQWRASGVANFRFRYSRRFLAECGGLYVFNMACMYLALQMCDSRGQVFEVGLVNYLWTVFTLLLSVPLLGMKAGAFLMPSAVLAMGGVLLASMQRQSISWSGFWQNVSGRPVPYALGLCAAATWGLYSVLSRKRLEGKGLSAVPYFMLTTGAVFLAARLFSEEQSRWSVRAALDLSLLTGVTAAAYPLWDAAMQKGNIALVASVSYATPFLSTVINCFYFQMVPGYKVWFGAALIVIGALGCRYSLRETQVQVK